jgi:hypothetical protein
MTKTRDLANLANGITSANIVDGAITNADVNNTAGIVSSKLNFTQAGSGAEQRTVESKLQDVVSVLDFIPESEHAAIKAGTSTYDAATAIQAAVDSATTTTTVWFPAGTYLISSPIEMANPRNLDGCNVKLKASASFVGADYPNTGGGTTTVSAMLIFLKGTYNDIGGARSWNANIGPLFLDCNNQADIGVYIERMPYSYIGCHVYNALQIGIDVGPYCWGVHCDSNAIESFGQAGIRIGAAMNGAQITSPKIWGNPTRGTYGIEFKDNNDSNGVLISGGLIERIDDGIFFGKRTGPVSVVGVDFEDITNSAIKAVGDLTSPAGRLVGPISCINTYLDSGGSIVYADNAKVIIDGCRTRASRTTKFDTANSGVIEAKNNELEGSGGWVSGTTGTVEQNQLTYLRIVDDYRNRRSFPESDQYRHNFYQFQEAPTLQSAQLKFSQAYHGGATGRYLSSSEWWISEYRHLSAPGTLTGKLGIILNNRAGQFAVDPYVDNQHTLGEASLRWKEIFCVNNVINVSDRNTKQQIRDLSDAERRVAVRVKGLLKAFKFNDAVAEKGDNARIHFGVIAQELEEAFALEGLDASGYGVFCKDEWWEYNGNRCLVDENGYTRVVFYLDEGKEVVISDPNDIPEGVSPIEEMRPAERKELRSVRYGELLAFIIAAL